MELTSPLNVHWELTNLCNLRCLHCYQQDDGPRTALPSAETTIAIARRIVEAGIFEVTLTGGEILLVPELRDVVTILNDNGIRPYITSNGMLIDDETADWLAAANITFQVSIDAADPLRHNEIRRSPHAFERALAGAMRLVDRGIQVSFAFVATPGNLDELPNVVALAAERDVRRVCVGEVVPSFGNLENRERLSFDPPSYTKFVTQLPALREQYSSNVEIVVALLSGQLHDARLKASPCTALERDLAILHDGWAYPCPFVRRRQYRLGNLVEQSVTEIWNSPRARHFRAKTRGNSGKHCIEVGSSS